MPTYEFRVVSASTGRKSKRTRRCFDEGRLRELLAREGVEPLDIVEIPDDLATERQVAYMVDLGVAVPAGLSKDDASSLLSNHLEHRTIAEPHDFEVARRLKIEVNRYASKAVIYRSILADMLTREDWEALAAWYAFRVYRNSCDRTAGPITDPLDDRFSAIGRAIAADAKLGASLRRAADSTDVQFRWFGLFEGADGIQREGDSTRTDAYRFALAELGEAGLAIRTAPVGFRQERSKRGQPPSIDERSGCTSNALAIIGAVALLAIGWVLFRT